jgi:hypothetical protein
MHRLGLTLSARGSPLQAPRDYGEAAPMTGILILGLPLLGFAASFAFRTDLSKARRRRAMKQYGSL